MGLGVFIFPKLHKTFHDMILGVLYTLNLTNLSQNGLRGLYTLNLTQFYFCFIYLTNPQILYQAQAPGQEPGGL